MTEILVAIAGVGITLCCFSFLYKDNPFYHFAESLYVGISAGYYLSVVSFHQVIKPLLLARLFPQQFASGLAVAGPSDAVFWIPAFLGILMLFKLVPSLSWISRYTIAFVMGVSTGLVLVTSIEQYIIPQIQKSIKPLILVDNVGTSLSNIILVLATICCLFYFFFSTEHKGPLYGNMAKLGIWFLMIFIGASFGSTVMGRLTILIGRFQYLANPLG
ncbi:MAG: hypothetical protein GX221_03615 [Candidatus Riflebacteria bacterium]|nr:hypothetical protein [Candidatus Riflebacteria bacterium]